MGLVAFKSWQDLISLHRTKGRHTGEDTLGIGHRSVTLINLFAFVPAEDPQPKESAVLCMLSLSTSLLSYFIMSTPENPRILALFDVDGTLTIPRGEITEDMRQFMHDLSKKITVGIVGGSDLPKQEEQLGVGIAKVFPYNFSQNGLVAYKDGELLEIQTISKHLGEENIKRIVNWVMKYLSDVDLPIKVSWRLDL